MYYVSPYNNISNNIKIEQILINNNLRKELDMPKKQKKAEEHWILKNKEALNGLIQGLKESSEGKIIKTNGNLDNFLQEL